MALGSYYQACKKNEMALKYFELSMRQSGESKTLLKKIEVSQQSMGQVDELTKTREKIESETTAVDRLEKIYDFVSQHSYKIFMGGLSLVVAIGFVSALRHFI